MATAFDDHELHALRMVVRRTWAGREALRLDSVEEEALLISLMAVGTTEEGQAAAELLQARRSADAAQRHFEQVLGSAAAGRSAIAP